MNSNCIYMYKLIQASTDQLFQVVSARYKVLEYIVETKNNFRSCMNNKWDFDPLPKFKQI